MLYDESQKTLQPVDIYKTCLIKRGRGLFKSGPRCGQYFSVLFCLTSEGKVSEGEERGARGGLFDITQLHFLTASPR